MRSCDLFITCLVLGAPFLGAALGSDDASDNPPQACAQHKPAKTTSAQPVKSFHKHHAFSANQPPLELRMDDLYEEAKERFDNRQRAREAASENLADHDPDHANKTRWFLAALQEWTEQDDKTYQTRLKAGDSLSAADHYRVNWDFVLHDPLIDRTPLAQRIAGHTITDETYEALNKKAFDLLDAAVEQNGTPALDAKRATKLATLRDTLTQFFYNGGVETGPDAGCTPTQRHTMRQLLFLLCGDMKPTDLEDQSPLFHLEVPHGDIDKIIQHISQYLCFAQPLSAPSKIALRLAHLRASFVDQAAGTLFDHLRQTPLGEAGVDEDIAPILFTPSLPQFAPKRWRVDYQRYGQNCSADFLSLEHGQLLTPPVDEGGPHNNPDFLGLLPDETLFKMLFTGGTLKSNATETEIRGFFNAYNPKKIVEHFHPRIGKNNTLTEPNTNAVIVSAQFFAPWNTMTEEEMRTEGYILGEEFGTGVSTDFMLDYLAALGYLEHRNA